MSKNKLKPYICDCCLKETRQVNFTGYTSMYWFCPECYHEAHERQINRQKSELKTA